MKDEDRKTEFEYHFRCADFELEFKGDEHYIRAMIQKYEGRVLNKLNQLVPLEKSGAAAPPNATAGQQQSHQQKPPAPMPPSQQSGPRPGYDKNRRRRGGFRKSSPPYTNQPSQEQKREPDDYLKDTPRREEIYAEQSPATAGIRIDPEELKSLNARCLPQTSHDRVMLMVYYLEQNSANGFTAGDVSECYQKLNEKTPHNLNTVLNNATRSGFLSKEEKAGRVKYHLTFKGKRYVENGLRLD